MIRDFSLLATTSRGNERDACAELQFLLEKVGDSASIIKRTGISGLIAAKTALNSFDVIEKLRTMLRARPYEFRYLLRVIPIEKVVCTDLAGIEQAAAEFSSKIGENETFRLTVEKRYSSLSTSEIIEIAAAKIHRKVDLSNPDKVLLIEVVGGLTGISVVKPDQVLSVLKEKVL